MFEAVNNFWKEKFSTANGLACFQQNCQLVEQGIFLQLFHLHTRSQTNLVFKIIEVENNEKKILPFF